MDNKYKFSAVLSSLTDFVNENTGLLAKMVASADTIKMKLPQTGAGITILDGMVGDSVKLNLLSSDIYWQNGNSCSFDTSGNTNFTQTSIDLDPIKYNESLCGYNFMPKWYGMMLKGGYSAGDIPFMDLIMNEKVAANSYQIELATWQGNKVSGSGNLALANGLIKNLSGTTTNYVSSAISSGTHTAANILSHIDAMIAGRPAKLMQAQNQVLFMSYTDYALYMSAMKTANLFVVSDTSEFIHKYPFSNVYIAGVAGLGTLRTWYLTTIENINVATNTIDELYGVRAVKDVVNGDYKLITRFVFGAGFADPSIVVHNNSAL